MSLMRLLDAGKSLMKMRDATTRYRMDKQYLLPKFGSPKNPFVEPAKSDSDQPVAKKNRQTQPLEHVSVKKAAAPDKTSCAAKLKNTISKRFFGEGSRAAAPDLRGTAARSPSPTQISRPVGKWTQKLNPFGKWQGRKHLQNLARAKFQKSPVQAELLWNKIKVVRNDLNDSDMEIVPAKPPVARPGAAPVPPAKGKSKPLEAAWGRVTATIFGGNAV